VLQQQQKNMMDQLGQILKFKYSKISLAAAGTQTAALAFGGTQDPPVTAATEEYDGSTWTSNPTGLNTARRI
jgi:hypothetical protein